MMIPGRKTLLGVAAAGLLLAGTLGTALAGGDTTNGATRYQQFTERLATILGKQPDEVRSAIAQVYSQYLDEAVAAGTLPADKAQAMKDRMAQGGAPFFGGPGGHGKGMGHGRAGHPGGGVKGEVVSVNGSTVTIKAPNGSEQTVLLTPATQVFKGRAAADASAITPGVRIAVHGQADDQGVVTAEKVHTLDGEMGKRGPRPDRRGPAAAPAAPTS